MTTKGKTPKCKHCGEWVDKSLEQHVYHSNKYYHNECYEITSVDGQHYRELIECICNNFNMQKPTMLIVSQIKNLKEKHGMKYKGMQMTIEYLLNVEMFEFSEINTSGIQMIEWYYEKTRVYYTNMQTVEDSFKGVEINTEPERYVLKRPKPIKKNLIKIEDI